MRFRDGNTLGTTAASLVLPIMILAVAVLAGLFTAALANQAGARAIYYIAVFGCMVIGATIAFTREEPLRFVFFALIICFPIAYTLIPPGRLGFSLFDAVMLALTIGLIGKNLFAPPAAREPLFPTRSFLIAWLLAIPSVALSMYPVVSLESYVLTFVYYVFFLFMLNELRRAGGFERLVLAFSIVSIVMALGLFVDHFLHMNLSLRGDNLNQLSHVGAMEIWRAGGFFQDPQRAGAFLAMMITFLTVLAIRRRFNSAKLRMVVWAAIIIGLAALVTTISRGAILACVGVSALALFLFNNWNAVVKLLAIGAMVVVATVMALAPEAWLGLVPAAVAQRFQDWSVELAIRLEIWFDTWEMFANHPLTGIGFGSFQTYLIDTRPGVINYYGIGAAEGIPYVPDQPENGYLKILYEGGIVGSIAALVIVVDAIRRAVGIVAGRNTSPDARTEGIAATAGLTVFGATFLTLFTVSDPRIAAVLALFLGVIWYRSLQRTSATPRA